jgi:hypothetical protein
MSRFLLLSITGVVALSAADQPKLAGDWKGESLCLANKPQCKDEKVVYHLAEPDASGAVEVSADKIVDGRAVNMGTVKMQYDKEKGTLFAQDGPRTWRFTIHGKNMEGTLTVPENVVMRKVTLTRD